MPMKPSKRIPVAHPELTGNEKAYVNDCLDSIWISSVGKYIQKFEESFAAYCHVPHAIACSNGTTALHLALLAMNVGPGDEVLVPSLTYIASANAVRYCGAEPVFLDSEPRTMNLDPALVEAAITPRTKGILVVHLYGHPVDMDPVLEVARRRGLFVIEDAAEAHGAEYKGRRTGGLGDIATFSFYGNKIVTTGEGGMITTGNRELDTRMRLLRGQGMDPNRRYWFPVVGYNYRMTNICAAIGLAQMERIEEHTAKRFRVEAWYRQHLGPLEEFLELPLEESWARHAYWGYAVRLRESVDLDRDRFMDLLEEQGIETRPVFYPMHVLPPYQREGVYLPVAERISRRGVCLPMHGLLTEEDVAYIAGAIRTHCEAARLASASRLR
jgi:perosamine synthetase